MTRRLAFAALLSLTACASQPPTQHYTLSAEAHSVQCAHPPILKVVQPRTAPGLDSSRIAVADAPNHLTYYTGAAWAAPLPHTAQHFLVDALQKTGAFRAVLADTDPALAPWLLLTDIAEFTVDQQQANTVRLRLTATLVRAKDRQILATIPIERSSAAGGHLEDLIAQFNQVMNEAVQAIATQSVAAIPGCRH
jgi:cholesterol transport system auxiliary component